MDQRLATEHLLKESMHLKTGSRQEIDSKAEPGNQDPGWGLWPFSHSGSLFALVFPVQFLSTAEQSVSDPGLQALTSFLLRHPMISYAPSAGTFHVSVNPNGGRLRKSDRLWETLQWRYTQWAVRRLTPPLFCGWKTSTQTRESSVFQGELKQWVSLVGSECPWGVAWLWNKERCGNQIMCRWSHNTAYSIMRQLRFGECKTCIPTLPQPLSTSGKDRCRRVNTRLQMGLLGLKSPGQHACYILAF